jgi:Pyridoxal-dependent decarboxylase conserved domain
MSQAIGAENQGIDAAADAPIALDPSNWKSFRDQAHEMLDDMVDYLENIRERPVWQPMSTPVRAWFRSGVPLQPMDLGQVHEEFMQHILPFAAGNVHPGFVGWVHGGGTPVGMLAEMLAGGLNANLGGRDHAPVEVERQVVSWVREIFRFPEGATGLFVTGTSMANLIAVVVARNSQLGFEVRRDGVAASSGRLAAYGSSAMHGCIAKAMDISGLGSDALRKITTDSRHRIDIEALQRAIQNDRRWTRGQSTILPHWPISANARSYGFMWTELSGPWRYWLPTLRRVFEALNAPTRSRLTFTNGGRFLTTPALSWCETVSFISSLLSHRLPT